MMAAGVIAGLRRDRGQLDPDRRRDGRQPRRAAAHRGLRRGRESSCPPRPGALVDLLVGLGATCLAAALSRSRSTSRSSCHPASRSASPRSPGLTTVDVATVGVALAAGVAGMLALETRASSAVGVGISITTIPAAAYLGVARPGRADKHRAPWPSSGSM